MLQNDHLVAKNGVDAAENEPRKECQLKSSESIFDLLVSFQSWAASPGLHAGPQIHGREIRVLRVQRVGWVDLPAVPDFDPEDRAVGLKLGARADGA